jgi:hypothetical protein
MEYELGAHLITPRWGFEHHGLYAGNGRVIQYTGFKSLFRVGPVEEVSLAEFSRGRPVRVQQTEGRFSGAAAVTRARMRLGEDLYRLVSNNCEHFVEWCISGVSRSLQVERFICSFRPAWAKPAGNALPR